MADIGYYTEEGFLQALGTEIRAWRTRQRLSRDELARRAGISATTLGRIERANGGAATVADVWRIAQQLQVAFPDLVRRAEDAAILAAGAVGASGEDPRDYMLAASDADYDEEAEAQQREP